MFGRPHFEVTDGYPGGEAPFGGARGMMSGASTAGINPSVLDSVGHVPGSGMGFTDEELLESLMYQPDKGAGAGQANDRNGVFGQPLRSLPRHLDASSPLAFNSPVSPSDIYSPGSASTSAADSFFREREGSFSAGDEIPHPGGFGKDSSGELSDRFDGARPGRAPSTRTRAIRRSSTSLSRRSSLHPPISVPTAANGAYPAVGYQPSARPQAVSVPTYLSAVPQHLGAHNAWTSSPPLPHAPSFDPSVMQNGFYMSPANATSSSADSGPRNGLSREMHRVKQGIAPSSAPVSRGSIARLPGTTPAGESDDAGKTTVLTEKKRRRRESHNAVERRRRDNINERISELATLLPEFMLEGVPRGNVLSATEEGAGEEEGLDSGALSPQAAAAAAKPNKGVILSKSVEYIRHLQSLVELQAQRNTELETILRSGAVRNFGDLSNFTSTIVPAAEPSAYPEPSHLRNMLSPSDLHASFKAESPMFDQMEE